MSPDLPERRIPVIALMSRVPLSAPLHARIAVYPGHHPLLLGFETRKKKLSFETEKTLCTRFAQEASAAQKGRRCALSNGSLSVIRSIASINTGIIFIYAVRGL